MHPVLPLGGNIPDLAGRDPVHHRQRARNRCDTEDSGAWCANRTQIFQPFADIFLFAGVVSLPTDSENIGKDVQPDSVMLTIGGRRAPRWGMQAPLPIISIRRRQVGDNDMVWYGMVWHGMAWYGMVWHGMVWYGMHGML